MLSFHILGLHVFVIKVWRKNTISPKYVVTIGHTKKDVPVQCMYMYFTTTSQVQTSVRQPIGTKKATCIKGNPFLYLHVPANHSDCIETVPIFDFQNLQKSGRPDFLRFQPANIAVLEVMCSRSFLCKLRRSFLYWSEPFVWMARGFRWGMQCTMNLLRSSFSQGFLCPMSPWVLLEIFGLWGGGGG